MHAVILWIKLAARGTVFFRRETQEAIAFKRIAGAVRTATKSGQVLHAFVF